MSYTREFDDYRQMVGADYADHVVDDDEMDEIEFDEEEDEEDLPRDRCTGDMWDDLGLSWSMFY